MHAWKLSIFSINYVVVFSKLRHGQILEFMYGQMVYIFKIIDMYILPIYSIGPK